MRQVIPIIILFFMLPTVQAGAEPLSLLSCSTHPANVALHDLEPHSDTRADECGSITMTCTSQENTETAKVSLRGSIIAYTTEVQFTTTTISCSGAFDLSILHHGGLSLRHATTQLTGPVSVHESSSTPITDEQSPCDYLGPTGACVTKQTGTWSHTETFPGVLSGPIEGCVPYATSNTGVDSLLSTPTHPPSQSHGAICTSVTLSEVISLG